MLAGHSVAEGSQQDLPAILAAVVEPLIGQLEAAAGCLPVQDGAVFQVGDCSMSY